MALRLKTVEYWFPFLASVPDNVATALTQITVAIPEAALSGVTFRTVIADVIISDAQTTSTNITSRVTRLTLQGAAASTVTNAQTVTQSGENFNHQFTSDFTTYFNASFGANATRTLDCSLTINTSAVGSTNASVRIVITYDFDDSDATHLKTVWIPLNADVNALPTAKTASDTIPALDTYLPEAGKNFRQITVVTQGNQESVSTTDIIRRIDIDSIGQVDATYEKGLNSSSWYRLSEVYTFDTSTTHTFNSWASATDFDHPQNYLVVTYEFDPSATTSIMNSLLLPMEYGGPMGGPSSADAQRGTRDIWIEETNPVLQRLAIFIYYEQAAAISSLLARVGNGAYATYSSVAATVCGGLGLMVRNDSAFTFARGKNTIFADVYNTDNTDLGFNLAALWFVNYTSDKPTDGCWAANHTIIRNLRNIGTAAASAQSLVSAIAPDIPETEFFVTSIGVQYVYTTNSTGNAAGVHIGAENDGANEWLNIYESMGGTDPEIGIRQAFATARSVFNRWYGDPDVNRIAIQTARRWRIATSAASFDHLDMYLTYHTIKYTVAGNITDSNGGTITISLHRSATGEKILETTRVGDGSYSFTWYDNTEDVYVVAYEDSNYKGRSADGLAI